MPITSEKRYRLVDVTDLDIVYVGGMHDALTFFAHDVVEDTDASIVIYFRHEKTLKVTERMTCLKHNIASFKYRSRTVRVEDTSPLPEVPSGEPVEVVGDPAAE